MSAKGWSIPVTSRRVFELLDAELDWDQARIADVGAGRGAFSQLLCEYLRHEHALEPAAHVFPCDLIPASFEVEGLSCRQTLPGGRLPFDDAHFDATVSIEVIEHVEDQFLFLRELVRVTKPGGTLYLSVPRAAAFDDRLYRFAGYFAKYALMKFKKRIEHQQRFDLVGLLEQFRRRGMTLTAHAFVPAGFSWMNDPRTKPLQGAFTDTLCGIHRATGLDLAADANFVLTFVKTGRTDGPDGRDRAALPGHRRVTHVCRDCGEHSIVEPPAPWPTRWTCPWCGKPNPFGRPR